MWAITIYSCSSMLLRLLLLRSCSFTFLRLFLLYSYSSALLRLLLLLFCSSTILRLFCVLLTVHPKIIIVFFYQLDAQLLYFNTIIIFLYVFRALLCSSAERQIVLVQHLVSSFSSGDCSVHRLREDFWTRCLHNFIQFCFDGLVKIYMFCLFFGTNFYTRFFL